MTHSRLFPNPSVASRFSPFSWNFSLSALLAFVLMVSPAMADSFLPPITEAWANGDAITVLEEDGIPYVRLTSLEPGKTVMIYREITIPDGVEALSLNWEQRISNLKPGEKAWFDARIMMEFMNADRQKVDPNPSAPYSRKDTDGWVEREAKFLVPEGARFLKFMPSLFQVESGTYDLRELSLTQIEAEPLREAAREAAEAKAARQAEQAGARQAKAAATLENHGNLISNGNFADGQQHWGKPGDNLSVQTENGIQFLRMQTTEPGKTVMVYREIDIPSGVEALELSLRWRISNLKPGAEPWYDARIMMDFKNASGKKIQPQPKPPYRRGSTDGWVEVTQSFMVPEGAVSLEFMPSLFQVKSGTMELADIVLKPTDAEAIAAAAAAHAKANPTPDRVEPEEAKPENWPPELKVVGNRLHDPDGNEVWLQGVHVVSLEWNPRGENVLASIKHALEVWNANVIRLSIKPDFWNAEKEADAEAYKKLIDDAINLTANRGAYLLIDNHTYRAVRERDIPFWQEIATIYKNHPAVLFDIINEPHGISWEVWRNGGFVEERQKAADEDAFLSAEELAKSKQGFESPGMQKVLEAIRETGAKNIVVAGGLDWAYDLSGIVNGYALEDKTGNGIMYSSHIYPWKSGWQKKVLDAAAKHPIFVGEVGANTNKMGWMPAEQQEDAETWVPEMLGLIQKYKLNWSAFSFHPKASPVLLKDWSYEPTPEWGVPAKAAMNGKQFEVKKYR